MTNQAKQTPDIQALKQRAAHMTIEQLAWNAQDASEAAEMAEELERAGCAVSKTGGYYRDEASFWRSEVAARKEMMAKADLAKPMTKARKESIRQVAWNAAINHWGSTGWTRLSQEQKEREILAEAAILVLAQGLSKYAPAQEMIRAAVGEQE